MFANLMHIKTERADRLIEFAAHVAEEFKLDQAETKALINSVNNRYDISKPLSRPTKMHSADSMVYRNQVRMAYIDLLAYFIQLAYIEHTLLDSEYNSRVGFEAATKSVNKALSDLHMDTTSGTVKESFYSTEDKQLTNTIITNGALVLAPKQVSREIEIHSVKTTILPVETDTVLHQVAGQPENLLKSGIGSQLWVADVYSKTALSLNLSEVGLFGNTSASRTAPVYTDGVAAAIEIETAGQVQINNLSVDFLKPTRILRMYYQAAGGKWQPIYNTDGNILSTEESYELEFHNLTQSSASNRFMILIATSVPVSTRPDTVTYQRMPAFKEAADHILKHKIHTLDENKTFDYKYHYTLGVYNLKLRDKSYQNDGTYISNPYTLKQADIQSVRIPGVDQDNRKRCSAITYYVDYLADGVRTHSIPVLPGSDLTVTEILPVSEDGFAYPTFAVRSILDSSEVCTLLQKASGIQALELEPSKKQLYISYKTYPTNSIAYRDTQTGEIQPTPPTNGTSFTVCYLPPNITGYEQVDVHTTKPVLIKTRTEVFMQSDMDGNVLELRAAPYLKPGAYDWDNNTWDSNKSLKITYHLSADDGEHIAVNYTNPSQQAHLDPYDAVGELRYIQSGNRVFLNTTGLYQVTVTYLTRAEAVRIRARLHSINDKNTAVLRSYEVQLNGY